MDTSLDPSKGSIAEAGDLHGGGPSANGGFVTGGDGAGSSGGVGGSAPAFVHDFDPSLDNPNNTVSGFHGQ
jgi:hypothetical protein